MRLTESALAHSWRVHTHARPHAHTCTGHTLKHSTWIRRSPSHAQWFYAFMKRCTVLNCYQHIEQHFPLSACAGWERERVANSKRQINGFRAHSIDSSALYTHDTHICDKQPTATANRQKFSQIFDFVVVFDRGQCLLSGFVSFWLSSFVFAGCSEHRAIPAITIWYVCVSACVYSWPSGRDSGEKTARSCATVCVRSPMCVCLCAL